MYLIQCISFIFQIRWVVESANARIKRFQLLGNVMPNSQVPFIGDFVRIVCAISNKYLPALSPPEQTARDEQVAHQMLAMLTKTNELQQYVVERGLERKLKVWKSVDSCEIGFPQLSEDRLRELTFGVYQLKMASSYIQEHLGGTYQIHVHRDDTSLLTVRLQSRHTSGRRYLLWIRSSQTEIESWYCQCRAGARVIGMCAHVAAIVWYLAYARHAGQIKCGVRDWAEHLSDAAVFQIDTDSSDNE